MAAKEIYTPQEIRREIEARASESSSGERFHSFPGIKIIENDPNWTFNVLLEGYFPDLRYIKGNVTLESNFFAPNLEEICCKPGFKLIIDHATCPSLSKIECEQPVALSGIFPSLSNIRSNSYVTIRNALLPGVSIISGAGVLIENVYGYNTKEKQKAIESIKAPSRASMDIIDCDEIKHTHIDPSPEIKQFHFTYEELKAKDEYVRTKKSELPEKSPELSNEHKKLLQEQIDACYKLLNFDRQLSQNKAEQKNVQPSKIKLSR